MERLDELKTSMNERSIDKADALIGAADPGPAWAGLLLAVNFGVAVWLLSGLEAPADAVVREMFGPMMCILAGLILATHGPGAVSLDGRLSRR